MRPVIMWNLVSLNGYFEGADKWDLTWHEIVGGDELERLSLEHGREADLLLFGRVTYEGMARYWPTAEGPVADLMNTIPKVVFSKSLDDVTWANTRLVREPPEDEVARLREQSGKPIFIFGSGHLGATLMRHRLIDEYRLGIVPVVLAAGTPLFKSGIEQRMDLVRARSLGSGSVILTYRPHREELKADDFSDAPGS